MIITPLPLDIRTLGIGGSSGVRSTGLHASDVYNDLYQDLEPNRYKRDTPLDPMLLETGLIWESILEEGLARRCVESGEGQISRPGEFVYEGKFEGVPYRCAYNPDLLIFNGETRVGEIKATWLSSKIDQEWSATVAAMKEHVTEIEGAILNPKLEKYHCVAPNTRLLTSDLRYVSAGSIKPGDSLIGFDEYATSRSSRRMRHTLVRKVKIIEKPCSRLYLSDGTDIVCSDDHRWFASLSGPVSPKKWRATSELLKSDFRYSVGQPRQHNSSLCRVFPREWTSILSEYERGYLEAMFDAEGCLHHQPTTGTLRVTVSQKPGYVLDRLRFLLHKDGFCYTESVNQDCVSLNIARKQDLFRLLAVIRPMRLLSKFETISLPGFSYDTVDVVDRQSIGLHPVVAIETDTHTYIAEGLASHNCQLMLYLWFLKMRLGRLYMLFIAGDYSRPFRSQFIIVDVEYSQDELDQNAYVCLSHAQSKGMLIV